MVTNSDNSIGNMLITLANKVVVHYTITQVQCSYDTWQMFAVHKACVKR